MEQDSEGHVKKQICRVRVFFLSFLTGMPSVELGVNDMTRMGLEVVGRYYSRFDNIPQIVYLTYCYNHTDMTSCLCRPSSGFGTRM